MGNVILGLLLTAGPQTVYSLSKLFEKGVSLFYRGGLGSIRGGVLGLLARGEVSYEEQLDRGRAKKVYRPTEAGRAAFFHWMTSPIEGSDVETAALSKLFFLGLIDSAPARREILDDITIRIASDGEALDALGRELDAIVVPESAQRAFSYQRAALSYGQGAHRFALAHFLALRDAEQ